ncbi:MAG: DUF3313 family protein [Parvularculaceae bacterium]|nr:DUF3313 family protein [Parvularculaceae bacterium]
MRKLILSLAILTLAACASSPTGPGATGRFDSFNAVQTRDFTGYDSVYIAMPTASEELLERRNIRTLRRQERPIGDREISFMANQLMGDLNRELGRVATIVGNPGPGVLTVQTEITKLNANRPTQTEMQVEPGLSFESIYAGDAAVTIRLLEDDKLLAVIKDEDNMQRLFDRGPQVFGIWDTARQHFGRVSAKLAALLQDPSTA